MASQTVLVLDFGGQYNQLIARRVRECSVYCEVRPYTTPVAEIKTMAPIGIIFTGGPNSVYDPASPQADPEIFKLGIPILGGIRPGVRQDGDLFQNRLQAVQGPACRERYLDEPRRLYGEGAGGL